MTSLFKMYERLWLLTDPTRHVVRQARSSKAAADDFLEDVLISGAMANEVEVALMFRRGDYGMRMVPVLR